MASNRPPPNNQNHNHNKGITSSSSSHPPSLSCITCAGGRNRTAMGWMKSLRCKSNALSDVNNPKQPSNPKMPASYCAASYADVLLLLPKHHSARRKSKSKPNSQSELKSSSLAFPLSSTQPLPELPGNATQPLVELPAGHPSRRVIEIIFTSSWSPRSPPFEIEMLFRVCNPPRTVARFEDYRAVIRSCSSLADARCAADGNEVMRFHCSSPSSAVYGAGVATCAVADKSDGGKVVEVIRTFAGSSGAHESSGGGAGRRAMLVCRVIAGRVGQELSSDDSVSLGSSELMVLDPRGVLPCFLIIYKV